MTENTIAKHPIPAGFENALARPEDYVRLYAESIDDPEGFWGREGRRLDWMTPYTKVKNTDFTFGKVSIKWFEDGVLNACVNCVDRHLPTRANQTAILFEPDDPKQPARHITYAELSDKVNRMANVLLSQGVMRGDRVVIYMPMILKRPTRCWPVRVSAPSIPSCSRVSAPMRWPTGSMTAVPRW